MRDRVFYAVPYQQNASHARKKKPIIRYFTEDKRAPQRIELNQRTTRPDLTYNDHTHRIVADVNVVFDVNCAVKRTRSVQRVEYTIGLIVNHIAAYSSCESSRIAL